MFYFVFCISVYLSKTCFFLQAFVSCVFIFLFKILHQPNQAETNLLQPGPPQSCWIFKTASSMISRNPGRTTFVPFRKADACKDLSLSLSLYHHLLLATCQNLSKPMGPRKHGGYALGLDDHDRYDRPSRLIWSSPSRQPGTICTVGFTTLLG